MSVTRQSLAETYAEQDAIIEAAQTAKRESTVAYRERLSELGYGKEAVKVEIDAFKLAYRRKVAVQKKGKEAVEEKDDLADEIYAEITAPRVRVARDARDGGLGASKITETPSTVEGQADPAHEPGATSPVEIDAAEISTPIFEEA